MSLLKLAIHLNKPFCSSMLTLNKFITISRTFSTTPKTLQKDVTKRNEWVSFYKFRYIQSLASVNKSKIILAAFTGIAVPLSFAVPVIEPLIVSSMGVSLVTTLCIFSFAFKNTVGFMYTNQHHPDRVKFAYLDFWGNRKEVETKIEDVVPFSELPKRPLDSWFTTLQFNSDHQRMKLFYKLGGVSDVNEFSKVFGIEH